VPNNPIAICTNEDCLLGENGGSQGEPTYWVADDVDLDDAEAEAFIGLDTKKTPNFCRFCLSPVIRSCPQCNRTIRYSEIWTHGCPDCGERLRFRKENSAAV